MAQLFCQLVPRHASWLLVGPPAATSLVPQQDITVTFMDGSSVVVPAQVPAVLPGGGTTWDRTQQVVVGYVVQGSGTLLAALESQLAALATDYAPLVRVLADSVQVYQPQQPGGAAIKSGAWSGGALLSSARSWSGGASVAGIAFWPAVSTGSRFGLYVLCTAYPVARTTLYDVDATGNGAYQRTSLTAAGHVICEYHNAGQSHSVDLGTLPQGAWYWLSTGTTIDRANNDQSLCWSALYNTSGTLLASELAGVPNMATNRNTFFSATLSVGRPGTGGYAAAPNDSTLRFSKLRHFHDGTEAYIGPLTSDTSGDLNDYMARQAVGAAATLDDTGTSNQDMTAGLQGLTINGNGPYA